MAQTTTHTAQMRLAKRTIGQLTAALATAKKWQQAIGSAAAMGARSTPTARRKTTRMRKTPVAGRVATTAKKAA